MWYKVYADGCVIDIIHADSPAEAVEIAIAKHGNADHWFAKPY